MGRKSDRTKGRKPAGATPSAYIDEQGRLCIGSKCVTIKVGDEHEVAVEIDPENCTEEERKALGLMASKVAQGAPTVYRTKVKK